MLPHGDSDQSDVGAIRVQQPTFVESSRRQPDKNSPTALGPDIEKSKTRCL